MLDERLAALMSLEGRAAIVTGGRGIGRAIAETLALAGARVAVADHAIDQEMRDWAGERLPGGHLAVVDLLQPPAITQFVDEVDRLFGRVDILVNNAGIYPFAPLSDLSVDAWDRTMDTNVRAAFLLTQRVAEGMKGRGEGRIVNISSLNTLRTYVGVAHYDASKAALEALTRACALELAAFNITCNAVAPGGVFTPGSLPLRTAKGFPSSAGAVEAAGKSLPLGRACAPDDVARAVWFFTSRAAAYVTGQILYVEGGVTIGPSPRA